MILITRMARSQRSISERIARGEISPSGSSAVSVPTPILPNPPGLGQVLGPSALNTHFFDGKLEEMKLYIQDELVRASTVPPEGKSRMFAALSHAINTSGLPQKTPNSVRCLKAIIDVYQARGSERTAANQNYDPANKMVADDLLYLLGERILSETEPFDDRIEYLRLLLSQLDEMATGLCPQGRVTRLFQCLVMLKKDL